MKIWSKMRFSSHRPLSAKRLAWESGQLMLRLRNHPAPRWTHFLIIALCAIVLSTAAHQFISEHREEPRAQRPVLINQHSDSSLAPLHQFESLLVAQQDIPAIVAHLLSAAVEEGLVLSRGTYRPEEDKAGRFSRYRMTLPVQGNARAIERFIDNALVHIPSLALEGIQISRRDGTSEDVEASIRWTLFTAPPAGRAR